MSKDQEISIPLGYDTSIKPTDLKLKQDALSVVAQYLQYWLPGEVECTVILGRPGETKVAYSTSITSRERLLHHLAKVEEESAIQAVLVTGRKHTR